MQGLYVIRSDAVEPSGQGISPAHSLGRKISQRWHSHHHQQQQQHKRPTAVEEDSGTFNRVTIGIRHRESARKYIKPLLVTKPESLLYVHLGTSGIDRDGIPSPALRTFQNNTPWKAKELFLPRRCICLIPRHYRTIFELRSLYE
jgi:hypothetical protein